MIFECISDFSIWWYCYREMSTLQGPVVCPSVRGKQGGIPAVDGPLMKAKIHRSGVCGFKGINSHRVQVRHRPGSKTVTCSFSSSSNGNGSMAESFNENDSDYVNSSVVEAGKITTKNKWFTITYLQKLVYPNWFLLLVLFVIHTSVEVKSGPDGFVIKMRDGKHLRCAHNNPQGGHLPDYAPHPAIVLKMEDGTGLLLPIIVCMCLYLIILFSPLILPKILELLNKIVLTSYTFPLQWRCLVYCSWLLCAMYKLYVHWIKIPNFLLFNVFIYLGLIEIVYVCVSG